MLLREKRSGINVQIVRNFGLLIGFRVYLNVPPKLPPKFQLNKVCQEENEKRNNLRKPKTRHQLEVVTILHAPWLLHTIT